jgi:hypothetical protein
VDCHEIMGQFVSECLPEAFSAGIATEGDDVGVIGFITYASPPPKRGDFPVQVPIETPAIRIVIDLEESSGWDTEVQIVSHILEKAVRLIRNHLRFGGRLSCIEDMCHLRIRLRWEALLYRGHVPSPDTRNREARTHSRSSGASVGEEETILHAVLLSRPRISSTGS